MNRYLFLTFLFLLCHPAFCQDVKPQYTFFRIDSVYSIKGDSALVRFKDHDGFVPDSPSTGWALGVRNKYMEGHDRELGKAFFSASGRTERLASIYLYDTSGLESGIYADDILELPVTFNGSPNENLFFDLCRLNIYFNDLYGEPFYHLSELVDESDLEKEGRILSDISAHIRETGEELDDPDEDILLASEKFGGETMFGAMKHTQNEDVRNFIHFVLENKKTYWGKNWSAAETGITDFSNSNVLTQIFTT